MEVLTYQTLADRTDAGRQLADRLGREQWTDPVVLGLAGLATGVTARAALRAVRQGQPRRLVFAAPVCAADSAAAMRPEADEITCVLQPTRFGAVSWWYHDFGQTSDEEVIALLHSAQAVQRSGG